MILSTHTLVPQAFYPLKPQWSAIITTIKRYNKIIGEKYTKNKLLICLEKFFAFGGETK